MGLWDKFRSDKKSGRYLGTGTKIRRIRSQKDTTVVELANALGAVSYTHLTLPTTERV